MQEAPRVLTVRVNKDYGKAEYSDYQLYVAMCDFDHTKSKVKSPQMESQCERFHKALLKKLYRPIIAKTQMVIQYGGESYMQDD